MNDFRFDPASYLARIGVDGPVKTDEQSLDLITRAQGYSIPFENFDILLGRRISLDSSTVFSKLVHTPRGGYCFELNGLLLSALRHFGFTARPLLARVHLRGDPTARTHQLLLVSLHNRDWIADVGFGGGGLLAPVPFETGTVFEQDGLRFRLIKSEQYDHMLQLARDGGWQNLYSFDLTFVGAADIALGNYYTSTHPECFFTYARIATLPVPGGRISLKDFTLKTARDGREDSVELAPGQSYLDALQTHFGIQLDAGYQALKPLPSKP